MPEHDFIPVIGLVGGVGSGKSSVAQWLSRQRKVLVVQGDEVGHEVLQIPSVKQQIQSRFGELVFGPANEINRSALGRLVFGPEPEQRQARLDLESIVHPEIRNEIARRIAEAKARKPEAVVLDAAVMFEAGWHDMCNAVVFVDVPQELRLERLSGQRGWDDEELGRREASQLPLAAKRERSDYVLDNSGPVSSAGAGLERILEKLKG